MEAERAAPSKDGGLRFFRHATSPVRDPQGKTVQVVELVEDVTARKALEAEALHSSKLSVLGQVAAGVAHEIGNPLSSLSARLDLMERDRNPAFISESVGLLRGQIERIRRIVRGISAFARQPTQDRVVLDIREVLEETIEMVRMDSRSENVEVSCRLAATALRVRGVRDQLLQVFLNLTLNSLEAMPEGGTFSLEADEIDGRTRVVFSDTGRGIPGDLRDRLFEPFVTTKPDGSGLGLSISHSFVHAHGGSIEVESRAGAGCRFVVWLPVAEASELLERSDKGVS